MGFSDFFSSIVAKVDIFLVDKSGHWRKRCLVATFVCAGNNNNKRMRSISIQYLSISQSQLYSFFIVWLNWLLSFHWYAPQGWKCIFIFVVYTFYLPFLLLEWLITKQVCVCCVICYILLFFLYKSQPFHYYLLFQFSRKNEIIFPLFSCIQLIFSYFLLLQFVKLI